MLRAPAPLIGALGVTRKEEEGALSIIADMNPANPAERIARVLSALGEPGGGRRLEMFASARLALSSVGERAGLVLSLLSNASQPFARVLLALGEAGCGLALGQSSVGRLARHCVGSRAEPKTICLAGPRASSRLAGFETGLASSPNQPIERTPPCCARRRRSPAR